MSLLCYDFQKWTMIPSSLIGAVTMQEYVYITYLLISNQRISKSHILDEYQSSKYEKFLQPKINIIFDNSSIWKKRWETFTTVFS